MDSQHRHSSVPEGQEGQEGQEGAQFVSVIS